jgi:hypothetical protein
MIKKTIWSVLALGLLVAAGCNDNPPMYGRAEKYDRTHLQFGDGDLEQFTRVDPVTATRDPAGLLHVTVSIRSTIDKDQYVDGFCTFLRNGAPVDKEGPKTVTLKANLPDTIAFDSSTAADDYFVSLSYAK